MLCAMQASLSLTYVSPYLFQQGQQPLEELLCASPLQPSRTQAKRNSLFPRLSERPLLPEQTRNALAEHAIHLLSKLTLRGSEA